MPYPDPEPISTTALRRGFAAATIGIGAVVTLLVVIWGLTGAGYFWPIWPVLPLGLLLGIYGWVTRLLLHPQHWGNRLGIGFGIHAGASAAIVLFLTCIWALTTRWYYWPIWPALGLGMAVAAHLAIRHFVVPDQAELQQRIETLTTTRTEAINAQEAELRRIERDLHDGAQARLVALGMSIGMAEQKLANDPEGARQLLAEARAGAHDALGELRDLVRGIHPPVLADRGLDAAVRELAVRSPLKVFVSVNTDRLPPAVETAAYFVAAEGLANASKHAQPNRIDIRINHEHAGLVVEVVDDGKGGADANGNGLTGLRRRVEALDGRFRVASPAGGPTVIRAEMPCEW